MRRAFGRLASDLTALFGALALLVALVLPALAQSELPPLTGRVVDNAGIIDAATEASLTTKLAAFEAKSSDQIVVATVATLNGEAIEPYANRLFRAWGLGQAGEDNGILLLVAQNDRKMRIEVGYGREGALTDLHSKLIIENTMVPAFRAGDFSGGISKAVDDIILVLDGNAAELEARYERNQPSPYVNFVDAIDWPFVIFGSIFFLIFSTVIILNVGARLYGEKIAPGRYRWLGVDWRYDGTSGGSSSGSGGSSWSSGSSSSSGSSYSGGGGSSGGGGASGSW